MFCKYCGKEIEDNAKFCAHCGKKLTGSAPQQGPANGSASDPSKDADSNVGFGILSFIIPLVGLVLFLVWNDKYPARAKACGIGALAGVIIGIIIWAAVACGSFSATYEDEFGEFDDDVVVEDFVDEDTEEGW